MLYFIKLIFLNCGYNNGVTLNNAHRNSIGELQKLPEIE